MQLSENNVSELNNSPNTSDKNMGYALMPTRTGFLLVNTDKRLIREQAHTVREALFACTTQPQVECAVAFARYLSFAGLNSDNYWLFLRMIMTNNPWVIDELLHERTPRLLFSTIRADSELIEAAFEMLFSRHPEEIYPKALESVLGIIQNAYFDADDGYRIRRLSIMDINALGKFLIKDEPQEHPLNRLILEVLDRIAHLGDYYGEQDKNILSKHAFNVRYAYFDHTRELVDAIPEPMLVRMGNSTEVSPEDDYATLVSIRRQRKRDFKGRFTRESPEPSRIVEQPNATEQPKTAEAQRAAEPPKVADSPPISEAGKKKNPPTKSISKENTAQVKKPAPSKTRPKKKS